VREAGCSIESLIGNEGQKLDIYAKSVICAGNQEPVQDAHRVILEGVQLADMSKSVPALVTSFQLATITLAILLNKMILKACHSDDQ
jgi:hypothetical protein